MNGWLWAAVIIAVIAIVFLIICIVAAVFSLKSIIQGLNYTIQRLKGEQVDPLLNQTKLLATTANKLKDDVTYKKQQLDTVFQAVKGINENLTSLQSNTRTHTQSIIKKVEADPARQAQTEQWTNQAMGFLNRK